MLLAVDIGNSQTSFGLFERESLKHHWRLDTRAASTIDSLLSFLHPLFSYAGLSLKDVTSLVICSVVPSVDRIYQEFAERHLKLPLKTINHRSKLGFELNVDTPGEVGADRLANVQYAIEKMKLPVIVVDFGTATTFDLVVERSGRPSYEGGVILPGVRIALEALSSRTSKLSSVDLKFPASVVGRNTTDCIQSGLLYGYVDQIDGLIDRFNENVRTPCEVVLTGGLGALFQDKLRHKCRYEPDLTLQGIRLLSDN
ncbi:MAG: type III pantothenate kinase [Deltaproteobacteria bacterium]|nr:type III pantothenate kinase [Deltaproteobacteria bacterium]